jgi:SOS-response transcriptional repressor LexA
MNPAPSTIPILPSREGGCEAAEPFALMVLGDSMAPEFSEGDIVIVEPDGIARDGSFVIAQVDDEWTLRQLRVIDGATSLYPLNPAYPAAPLANLALVRGVVIQKSRPGQRRLAKRYVE